MDIINVLKSELRSEIDVAAFEINSVLAEPTKKGSVDRLAVAVATYTRKIAEAETLNRLQGQVQAAQEEQVSQEQPQESS
jgi:hypothetical protein